MGIENDITFAQKHLPVIKRIAKVLGLAVFAITVWKGIHGFFPTAGIITAAAFYVAGDLL